MYNIKLKNKMCSFNSKNNYKYNFCIYFLISTKTPSHSMQRMMAPLSFRNYKSDIALGIKIAKETSRT